MRALIETSGLLKDLYPRRAILETSIFEGMQILAFVALASVRISMIFKRYLNSLDSAELARADNLDAA